jgi:uncharacterized membrane protein YoaK (UPF0700 family)
MTDASPDASPDSSPAKPVSTWRKVLAGILDFFTIFFVAGYVIGYATGNLTEDGFELTGGPAFLFFATVIAYFVVFSKYLGGTLWQRVLKTR